MKKMKTEKLLVILRFKRLFMILTYLGFVLFLFFLIFLHNPELYPWDSWVKKMIGISFFWSLGCGVIYFTLKFIMRHYWKKKI
jgi:hypothetical protein